MQSLGIEAWSLGVGYPGLDYITACLTYALSLSVKHRPLVPIQLCLVFPLPSVSNCTLNLL